MIIIEINYPLDQSSISIKTSDGVGYELDIAYDEGNLNKNTNLLDHVKSSNSKGLKREDYEKVVNILKEHNFPTDRMEKYLKDLSGKK